MLDVVVAVVLAVVLAAELAVVDVRCVGVTDGLF